MTSQIKEKNYSLAEIFDETVDEWNDRINEATAVGRFNVTDQIASSFMRRQCERTVVQIDEDGIDHISYTHHEILLSITVMFDDMVYQNDIKKAASMYNTIIHLRSIMV